jgi:hypothetical protein
MKLQVKGFNIAVNFITESHIVCQSENGVVVYETLCFKDVKQLELSILMALSSAEKKADLNLALVQKRHICDIFSRKCFAFYSPTVSDLIIMRQEPIHVKNRRLELIQAGLHEVYAFGLNDPFSIKTDAEIEVLINESIESKNLHLILEHCLTSSDFNIYNFCQTPHKGNVLYFLLEKKEVVYIGVTSSPARFTQHKKTKQFDTALVLPSILGFAYEYERQLLPRIGTKYNKCKRYAAKNYRKKN